MSCSLIILTIKRRAHANRIPFSLCSPTTL